MSNEDKVRMDAWTTKEDEVLVNIIINTVREGKTQLIAFEKAGYRLGRTSAACSFRWNNYSRKLQSVRSRFEEARREARKESGRIKSYAIPRNDIDNEKSVWVKAYESALQQSTEVVEVEDKKTIVEGVCPDAPVVYNSKGGGQSYSPYRLDLIDPKALLATAKVLKEGADKYGENNWKLIKIDDHLNHLLVHVYAYLAGDRSDEHLSHAVCRALFALGVELGREEE